MRLCVGPNVWDMGANRSKLPPLPPPYHDREIIHYGIAKNSCDSFSS